MTSKPTLITAVHKAGITAVHEAGHAVARLALHPSPMIRHMTLRDLPEGTLGEMRGDSRWVPGVFKVTRRQTPTTVQ
jgi:hypothetical protein